MEKTRAAEIRVTDAQPPEAGSPEWRAARAELVAALINALLRCKHPVFVTETELDARRRERRRTKARVDEGR